ncbi:cellulase family glycosylhydrolase [Oligoflexus tunisiensis]|uniref:cellulase family glycosylhydrolase n=1 Tax=Oligoflexus tunisiensis TaxID=708132 RepID=UPI000ADCE052|nr:cellulase family glycosylhydrolase [Oligoflexus tunisiensis]
MKNLIAMTLLCAFSIGMGCQDSKSIRPIEQENERTKDEESPKLLEETPRDPERSSLSFIRQDGRFWVDALGKQMRLRGTNLGNWLQLEFWMMGSPMNTDAGPIGDQCTLENELEKRFGAAEKERLMAVYRDSWMTARDWDIIQSLGHNIVRLPFMYNLVEDQYKPYTLRSDAWVHLDRAIDEAEKRGMYTIIDLHGAVGSQGWEHHSGCAGKNQLWGSQEYRKRTRWLWEQIAERYKNRAAVAGYGLLNEPWGTDPTTLASYMADLYTAIRAIDQQHIIILPGHNSGIDAYGDPAKRGMKNVAFEMHFYPGFWGWGEGQDPVEVHRDWLFCGSSGTGGVCDWNRRLTDLNTPFLVGEFQPWTALGNLGGAMTRLHYDTYNALGWAATSWAYKTVSRSGSDGSNGWNWGTTTNHAKGGDFPSINISKADKKEIEDYFRKFASQPLLVNETLRSAMTREAQIGVRNEAEHFSFHKGVSIEKSSDADGGLNVAYADDGDWMSYPIHIAKTGRYRLELRVASPHAGGQVIVGRNGKDLVSAAVPQTGDWQKWQTLATTVQLEAGQQDLTVWVEKGGWNFNWWVLTPQ